MIEVKDTRRKPYKTRGKLNTNDIDRLRRAGGFYGARELIKSTREQRDLTNKELDEELRSRGFVLYTAKGIDDNPRIANRINAIVRKQLRRAIKVAGF